MPLGNFDFTIDLINGLLAALALVLGLRIVPKLRFTFQQRAARLLLAAVFAFACGEMLAMANILMELGWGAAILAEVAETVSIFCMVIAFWLMAKSEKHEIAKVRQLADSDTLTLLPNIRYFRHAASDKLRHALVVGAPLALLMLDIDNFKAYNDEFGHEAGNTALRAVARTIKEAARADDLLARYGGEEFVVLTSEDKRAAKGTAERIRLAVESACRPAQNAELHRPLTVSIGLATLEPNVRTLDALIEAADTQLYRAKKAGKNRVYHSDIA